MAEALSKVLIGIGLFLLLGSFFVPAKGQPAMLLFPIDPSPPYCVNAYLLIDGQKTIFSFGQTVEVGFNSVVSLYATFKDDESPIVSVEAWLDGTKIDVFWSSTSLGINVKTAEVVLNQLKIYRMTVVVRNKMGNQFTGHVYLRVTTSKYYILSISLSGGGTTSPPPGVYTRREGEVVNIRASPSPGWGFKGWFGKTGFISSSQTISITMNENKTVVAVFEPLSGWYWVRVSVDPPPGGRVLGGGRLYPAGENVVLKAEASEFSRFSHWSGDASGSENPITVTVDRDLNIVAHFELKEVPSGSLYINNQLVAKTGTLSLSTRSLTFKFIPTGPYVWRVSAVVLNFSGPENSRVPFYKGTDNSWEQSVVLPKNGSYSVKIELCWMDMWLSVAEVTLNCQEEPPPKDYVKIDYVCLPRIGGSIVGCKTPVPKGTQIEVRAFPNRGWRFVRWTGYGEPSTNPKLCFVANENMTVFAEFEAVRPMLSMEQGMRLSGGILLFVGVVSLVVGRLKRRRVAS